MVLKVQDIANKLGRMVETRFHAECNLGEYE